ncbi:Ubiquitin-conjugating enzyme E2 37 [Actinidia chinensis var. chinensis]|uniref:Ubiquitin-conjugating enzyme E2 37 n=1 Tax=Actinidia chinensis var. chinensis TaxID=1590841 RepID=A0A2R6Q766_ACTCC|nr:Ubiquitin-conjugating enzyme E2 37 [Actinidia chinensis var. chinensis]
MESSSVISPEDVMECLMNDGTIDAMRLKIINQLKANEELKNTTIKMAEQSKVLNTPGAEKQTKRELFDALRQELETSVLEKASKSVWELILDNNGLGKEISETVEGVFCRLSGREPPLFPPNIETQPEKKKEKVSKKGKGKGKGKERENGKENSDSTSKKRKLDEMNCEDGADEVASGSSKPLAVPDSSKVPQPNLAT